MRTYGTGKLSGNPIPTNKSAGYYHAIPARSNHLFFFDNRRVVALLDQIRVRPPFGGGGYFDGEQFETKYYGTIISVFSWGKNYPRLIWFLV